MKLAGLGVTVIELGTGTVMVSMVVPVTPACEAVMVAVPALVPVARPALLMVTTDTLLEDQVTVAVMLAVVPLL